MTEDLTDRLIGGWAAARPELEINPLQVTARLSRIGPLLARRQEEVFSQFGLAAVRSGCSARCGSRDRPIASPRAASGEG